MYDELKELLKHEAREIMKTPSLLMLMLKLYSQIFLNSEPCSTCEKKHAGYIARLHREGENQIKKNKIMTKENEFKLIPEIIMHTPEGLFSEANITDKISVRLCKKYPALRGNYVNPPELEKAETEEEKAEKARLAEVKKAEAAEKKELAKKAAAEKKEAAKKLAAEKKELAEIAAEIEKEKKEAEAEK